MVRSSVFAALCAGSLLIGVVVPVRGDYWTQYQSRPDAPYLENQGWQRVTAYGGSVRSIDDDGNLVLDSRASGGIVDYYRNLAPGMIHADPGHPFALEWRLSVDYSTEPTEISVGVFSDDRWCLGFEITSNRIYDAYAYPAYFEFVPGWHTFRMVSPDMRTYALAIDGVAAMSGHFDYDAYFSPSIVSWGDGGQGGVSLSRWDRSGFGITPEPTTAMSLGLVLVLRVLRRGQAGPHSLLNISGTAASITELATAGDIGANGPIEVDQVNVTSALRTCGVRAAGATCEWPGGRMVRPAEVVAAGVRCSLAGGVW
jgi:hypothetical protein